MPSATLDLEGDRWVLRCSPRASDLAALIPGLRYDRKVDAWSGPATLACALAARGVFGEGLSPTDAAFDRVQDYNDENAGRLAILNNYDGLVSPDPRLFPFQVSSTLLMSEGWFLNCDGLGNGKSVQTAVAIEQAAPAAALIVATKSMLHTWAAEVRKWAPSHTPVVVEGTLPQRRKIINEHLNTSGVVFICTRKVLTTHTRHAGYGSVIRKPEHKEDKEFNGGWIEFVALDEAHAFKDPKSQQTRAAWGVGDTARVRVALTATPVVNTPLDLWSILRFLDPDSFPSKSKFRDRYVLTYENFWGAKEDLGLNPQTREEFDRIVLPHYVRRDTQVEVQKLPPQVRYLDMEPKQAKAYRQMETDMLADVDSGLLLATDVLTKNTRLLQMAAALPVLDDEGNVTSLSLPSCKVAALLDLLDEMNGDPLVVFAESRKLIELCYNVLTGADGQHKPILEQEKVGIITGAVKANERHAHVEAFQAGEQDVMLLTIGAGSEGITLTKASVMAFLQRSYRYVGNTQAEGRIHRHGQERDTLCIDFITKGTVESRVHEAAAEKGMMLEDFVRSGVSPETLRGT
jgi:SNF2 family DNA or RNA helicase